MLINRIEMLMVIMYIMALLLIQEGLGVCLFDTCKQYKFNPCKQLKINPQIVFLRGLVLAIPIQEQQLSVVVKECALSPS